MFEIPGYSLHRRDRCRRKENGKLWRGGGVAVYVGDRFESNIFKPITDRDCSLELLWVMLVKDGRTCYVRGLYHPPNSIYQESFIIQLIEHSLKEHSLLDHWVCLAEDFNQFPDSKIQSLGLIRTKAPPIRDTNYLERIFTTDPVYDHVIVINPTIKTDHMTIYAHVPTQGNIKMDANRKQQIQLIRSDAVSLFISGVDEDIRGYTPYDHL